MVRHGEQQEVQKEPIHCLQFGRGIRAKMSSEKRAGEAGWRGFTMWENIPLYKVAIPWEDYRSLIT